MPEALRHRILVCGDPAELGLAGREDLVVVPPGLEALEAALPGGHWNGVVVAAPDPGTLLAAADLVRRHPPDGFLLVVGPAPLEAFADSALHPYETWTETTPSSAPIVLERALEALLEKEALAAVRANRVLFVELAEVLVHDRPLAEAVERSMAILARGLGCSAASFWQGAAAGDEVRRVACTGPLRALDVVAAGDEREPICGQDRLLELPMDTPVGQVLTTGTARFPRGEDDGMLLPAATNGRTVGVIVLMGAERIRRRPTTFELATSAAAQIAAFVSLREAGDRFDAVTSSSTDAIVLADARGHVTAFNVGAERMFGRPAASVLGRPLTLLMPERFRQAHRRGLRRVTEGAPPRLVGQVLELTGVRASGEEFPLELSMSMWTAGPEPSYVGILRDVSGRHRSLARIRELAYVDQVTGLANEPALRARLAELEGTHVGLLAVDLGRFGTLVEALGSAAADEVLRAAAGRLRDVLGPRATWHRRQGDAFLALLEEPDPAELVPAAEAVLEALRAPVALGATSDVVLRGHAGVAHVLVDDPRAVVDRPLQALGAARAAGPNAVRRYEQVEARVREELELEGELRRGIAAGELVLHHQPIVDLRRGRVRGVESLVRWQHPSRGLLPPGAFIEVAERTGLIDDLGRWVIDAACAQAAAFAADGLDLTVGLNVSPRQLLTGDVVDHLRTALIRSGVEARKLTVELTESAALTDLESSLAVLHGLRGLGVRLALDDFGVGESSLGRLAELPVDILKIDRSLVSGLPGGRAAQALTGAALELALGLGLRTVAEGVEDAGQLAWLQQHGCRDAQGFLLSRPVAAPALPDAIAAIDELLRAAGAPARAGAEVAA